MSDVFLSYASDDRPRIEILAKALESQGFSVWWDHHIPPGTTWDKVIENALSKAKCVVVLWTPTSVESDWVRTEAGEGRKRKILIPVLLDEVEIPLAFRRVQTMELTNWEGSVADARFQQLAAAISRILEQPNLPEKEISEIQKKKKIAQPILWLVLPTILITAVVWMSMGYRMATVVQINLTTDRVTFTTGGAEARQRLMSALPMRWITLEKFAPVSFRPEQLEVADPESYSMKTDTFSEWVSIIEKNETVTLTGLSSRQPKLTLEPISTGTPLGTVDDLYVTKNAEVMFMVNKGNPSSLTARLITMQATMDISVPGTMEIIANQTQFIGTPNSSIPKGDEVTYRAKLSPSDHVLTIRGGAEEFLMNVGIEGSEQGQLLSKGIGPIEEMDFSRLDEQGNRVAPGVFNGEIRYPDYSDIPKRPFSESDYLTLGDLLGFAIKEIKLNQKEQALDLLLSGTAGIFRSGVITSDGTVLPESIQDRRLTAFEVIRYDTGLTALLTILGWMVPTSWGVYRFAQELKR